MNSTTTSFLNYQNQSEVGTLYFRDLFVDLSAEMQKESNVDVMSSEFIKIYTIKKINSAKFILRKPIAILISKEDQEYKAELKSLELVAFGESEGAVITEITEELADLCEVIFSHKLNELGQFPKKWRNILVDLVKKDA